MHWNAGYTAALIVVATVVWLIITFNTLTNARNLVRAGWSDIDVQLQRRHDLVPQLVAAVKGYAAHEKALLETVTALRNQAAGGGSPAQRSAVERQLSQQLVQVLALREAYPDLKANQNFSQLQAQLVTTEDMLQLARRFYNGAVRQLNDGIQLFPNVLVSGRMGFRLAEYFQADDREAPKVSLS